MRPGNAIIVAGGTEGAIGFRCVRTVDRDALCPGNVVLLTRAKFSRLFPKLDTPPPGIEVDDRAKFVERKRNPKRGTGKGGSGKGAGTQAVVRPVKPEPEPVEDPE